MDIVWQAEDSLREKKLENDLKDILKTMVAFANSVAPNDTAVIYVGEKDDGTVQGVSNSDNIQKAVRREADKIYPEINYKTEVYKREDKTCVRIEIRQNGLAPHFGGSAWVRRGAETVQATEVLYQRLIDLRLSKVHMLSKWERKRITVATTEPNSIGNHLMVAVGTLPTDWLVDATAVLKTANSHWPTITFTYRNSQIHDSSHPMENLTLSWDDDNNRLKVILKSRGQR
jgi:hypothetical protein